MTTMINGHSKLNMDAKNSNPVTASFPFSEFRYLLFLVGFLTEIGGLLIYAKTIPSFLATNLHLPDEYELPFVS